MKHWLLISIIMTALSGIVSPRGACWSTLPQALRTSILCCSPCCICSQSLEKWGNTRNTHKAVLRPLVVLRGGTIDTDDPVSDGDGNLMNTTEEGQSVVSINPADFDANERWDAFDNMTLAEFEEAVYKQAAAAQEKDWLNIVEEQDALSDTEAQHSAKDKEMIDANEDEDSAGDSSVKHGIDVSKMPAWMRESMEKQALPVEAPRITSFLEKYHEFFAGKINKTNVEQGLAYVEGKLEEGQSALKHLLRELQSNLSSTSEGEHLEGVGLAVSCTAPLHICVITRVVPLLSAWDAGVQPGDIVVAINGLSVKSIVARKLEEYQAALRASVDDEDVQLRLEIDSRGAREWKHSNETDLLIHHTLRHALQGKQGTVLNVTIQRTFRYIQRTLKGDMWKHPLYDGRPVLKDLWLTCRTSEALPPNWCPALRPNWLHTRVYRREKLLEELLESKSITQERYDYEISRIPTKIVVASEDDPELFMQIYPCYYNTVSKRLALNRPTQDALPPATTEHQRFLTASLWNASMEGNSSLVTALHAQGADPNWRNPDWRLATPLMKAAEHGHLHVVEALLAMPAVRAAETNALHWSALHYACFSASNVDVVERLVKAGLPVDGRTESGYSPLHLCAFNGNYQAVKLLVAAGADKGAQERHHKVNAAELVMMNGGRLRRTHVAGPAGKRDLEQLCLDALAPLPPDTRTRHQMEDELLIL